MGVFLTGSSFGSPTIGKMVPPRDPDDDDDAEDEQDNEQDDDSEPAVIREPDE